MKNTKIKTLQAGIKYVFFSIFFNCLSTYADERSYYSQWDGSDKFTLTIDFSCSINCQIFNDYAFDGSFTSRATIGGDGEGYSFYESTRRPDGFFEHVASSSDPLVNIFDFSSNLGEVSARGLNILSFSSSSNHTQNLTAQSLGVFTRADVAGSSLNLNARFSRTIDTDNSFTIENQSVYSLLKDFQNNQSLADVQFQSSINAVPSHDAMYTATITSVNRLFDPFSTGSIDNAYLEIWNAETGNFEILTEENSHLFNVNFDTSVIAHGWTNGRDKSVYEKPELIQEIGESGSPIIDESGTPVYREEAGQWGYQAGSAIKTHHPDTNILAYNWFENADTTGYGTDYIPNSSVKSHGHDLAQELNALFQSKAYPINQNISMNGFSLGAGVVSHATDYLQTYSLYSPTELTLLDAPEDGLALVSGGKVYLRDVLSHLAEDDNITIRSYHGTAIDAFGVDYSGISSTALNGLNHGEVVDWFLGTINPSQTPVLRDGVTDVNGDVIPVSVPKTSGGGKGYTANLSPIGISDEIFDYVLGGEVSHGYFFNGELATSTFFDQNFEVDAKIDCGSFFDRCPSENEDEQILIQNSIIDLAINTPTFFSPTSLGSLSVQASKNLISMFTGSPVYTYFDFTNDGTLDFLTFEFLAQSFNDGAKLAVYLDNMLLDFWTSEMFSDSFQSSGKIDLSFLGQGEYTLTLGWFSDVTGNQMDVRNIAFVNSTTVNSPNTLAIFLIFLMGMFLKSTSSKSLKS
jgi:hypothetical protein